MSEAKKQLRELLKERSFRRGTFQLASGGTSDYYLGGRMTEVFSKGAHLIGEVLYERTKDLAVDALGGLAVGAVPLTTAAVISYHQHGRSMGGLWVRDRAKSHGTQKLIEGNLAPGTRVVILDDVITEGKSPLKAIQEVRERGCEVVRVLALVDRLQGAAQLFRGEGIADFQSVFTIRDFGVDGGST